MWNHIYNDAGGKPWHLYPTSLISVTTPSNLRSLWYFPDTIIINHGLTIKFGDCYFHGSGLLHRSTFKYRMFDTGRRSHKLSFYWQRIFYNNHSYFQILVVIGHNCEDMSWCQYHLSSSLKSFLISNIHRISSIILSLRKNLVVSNKSNTSLISIKFSAKIMWQKVAWILSTAEALSSHYHLIYYCWILHENRIYSSQNISRIFFQIWCYHMEWET